MSYEAEQQIVKIATNPQVMNRTSSSNLLLVRT